MDLNMYLVGSNVSTREIGAERKSMDLNLYLVGSKVSTREIGAERKIWI